MAKDKERSINPAQQQRKAEKAKALKKGRAELQAKRNEKLAKRNPGRLQQQIDDLKALETRGDIKPREKAILADLERDLKAVTKAREALGQSTQPQAPRPPRPRDQQDGPQSSLGKRRHDGQRKSNSRREDSGSDTDDSVRNIPWPRDTPPPVPRAFRRNKTTETAQFGQRSYQAPAQPAEVKTTYESAPQIRDLKKEAISRFVPNVVKRKQDAVKGSAGQLLEPEELDRLEREGYITANQPGQTTDETLQLNQNQPKFSIYNPKVPEDLQRLKAEEEAFERELAMGDVAAEDHDGDDDTAAIPVSAHTESTEPVSRLAPPSRHVEMEEVEDEDL